MGLRSLTRSAATAEIPPPTRSTPSSRYVGPDDDGLNCERWRESLRLEAALGVVSEDHLLDERAVPFADVERRFL